MSIASGQPSPPGSTSPSRAASWPAGTSARARARSSDALTLERSLDPSPSLVEVRVREPEPAERARESQRRLVVSVRRQPVERSAQVVVIAREPSRPLGFALQATGVRLLCESGEEARMSVRVDG